MKATRLSSLNSAGPGRDNYRHSETDFTSVQVVDPGAIFLINIFKHKKEFIVIKLDFFLICTLKLLFLLFLNEMLLLFQI